MCLLTGNTLGIDWGISPSAMLKRNYNCLQKELFAHNSNRKTWWCDVLHLLYIIPYQSHTCSNWQSNNADLLSGFPFLGLLCPQYVLQLQNFHQGCLGRFFLADIPGRIGVIFDSIFSQCWKVVTFQPHYIEKNSQFSTVLEFTYSYF